MYPSRDCRVRRRRLGSPYCWPSPPPPRFQPLIMSRVAVGAAVRTGSTPASSMTAVTLDGSVPIVVETMMASLGLRSASWMGGQAVEHLTDIAATTAASRTAAARAAGRLRRAFTSAAATSAAAPALISHREHLGHLFRQLLHGRIRGDADDQGFLGGEVGDLHFSGGWVNGIDLRGELAEGPGINDLGRDGRAIVAAIAEHIHLVADLHVGERAGLGIRRLCGIERVAAEFGFVAGLDSDGPPPRLSA